MADEGVRAFQMELSRANRTVSQCSGPTICQVSGELHATSPAHEKPIPPKALGPHPVGEARHLASSGIHRCGFYQG